MGRCSVQVHFPFEPLIADPFPQHLILWLRHVFSWHAYMLAMSTALMMHKSTIFILAEILELPFRFGRKAHKYTRKILFYIYIYAKFHGPTFDFSFRTFESEFSSIDMTFWNYVTIRFKWHSLLVQIFTSASYHKRNDLPHFWQTWPLPNIFADILDSFFSFRSNIPTYFAIKIVEM